MRYSTQLKIAFQLWIAFFWGAAAHAAQSSLVESIQNIPLDAFGWAALLAGGGGFVATVKKVAEAAVPFKNVYFEMFKDLLMSIFVGMVTWAMAAWWGVPGAIQVFLIPIMGYAGSRALERGIENGLLPLIDRFLEALGALIGLRPKDKGPQ
jgi:hypothetical protein